jgi:cupin superfamily acireductone dioxygenase involved in methionine salvage
MMEYRFEAFIQGHGMPDAVDVDAMRLLEAFEDLHPEAGGSSIGIDVKAKVLEVGFSAHGKTLEEAAERAHHMLQEVADAAGWKSLDVISLEGQPEEAEQALAS